MKRESVGAFRCPQCKSRLTLHEAIPEHNDEIESGALECTSCSARYPIRNFIPRFVPDDGYAANFGKQWNRYRLVQLDSANDFALTEDRFYRGTEWTKEELAGQRVLEVGSGAGRFTQILLRSGAQVFSGDYSSAVDANWKSNGPHPNLNLFQGDIYHLPVPEAHFDKVFCYGVLQHTPDVKKAFMSLVPFLRPGGKIAVDVYSKVKWPSRWAAKYVWRPLTTRMRHETLFKLVEWYVPRWLRGGAWLRSHAPQRFGKYIDGVVPCNDYRGADWARSMTPAQLEAWAVLDTFDALSPKFDLPQDAPTVTAWCHEARLNNVNVGRGAQGNIKANAVVPIAGLNQDYLIEQLEQLQTMLGECAASSAELLALLAGSPEALDVGAVREMISSGVIAGTAAIGAYRVKIKEAAEHVRGVLSRMY